MSGRVLNKIVTNGLIYCVDAANPKSYVSGSTVFYDLSVTNNNTDILNTPTYNSANKGALVFDGASQYATSNSSLGSISGLYYTFSSWFKPATLSSNTYVFSRGRDGSGNGWSLTLGISNVDEYTAGCTQTIPGDTTYTAKSPATTTDWVNLTGVYDRTNISTGIKLYVNGVFKSSNAITDNNLRSSTVGASICRIQAAQYAAASVATISVYNRVLSAEEILQNFNATRTRFNL